MPTPWQGPCIGLFAPDGWVRLNAMRTNLFHTPTLTGLMSRFGKPLLLLLGLMVVAAAPAEEAHHGLGAHVHGLSQLNLIYQEGVLEIELDSPAANLLGFEHRPRSEAEQERLRQVEAQLKQADDLFQFTPEKACTLQGVEVTSALLQTDHGHDHADEQADEHADFRVLYRFACPQLKQLALGLFRVFPAIRQIQVQMVVEGRQQSLKRSAEDNHIPL